jgi:uncharacterized repeat protein (TIGR01451 family)
MLIIVLVLSLGLVTVALAAAGASGGEPTREFGETLFLPSAMEADSLAPQQVVNPGFTVDLTRSRIWGMVNPGDVVTVSRTMGGEAYGAGEADGAGFFWTTLYDGSGNGHLVDIFGGDTLEFYVNGVLVDTMIPITVTGGIDVLANQVNGNIEGAGVGVPVTVTIGGWANEPPPGAPFETTTTDVNGDFTVTFSNMDLVAENLAAVDYDAGNNYIRAYLYPDPHVFLVQQYQTIAGYAPRFQNIHATVYITYPTDIRWEGDVWAGWPHGYYIFDGVDVAPNDVVEVSFDDSTEIISTLTSFGNLSFDTDTEQVFGDAPTGETVLLTLRQWQGNELVYTETHATADMDSFAATFGTDLRPRDWVDVIIADDNGNQTQLISGPPYIDAFMDPTSEYDCVFWRVDGPDLPVTITIETEAGTFTRENTPISNLGNIGGWGACYMVWGDGWGPIDFSPGNTVTLQTPSWSDSLVLADVSWMADTANDAIVGTAPDGEVEATVSQWNSGDYPINGSATQMATAASPYTAAFTVFDVRDGGSVEVRYFDPASDFATHIGYWEDSMRYFQVDLPYGIGGWTPIPDEEITAWLYDSGGSLKTSTTDDHDGDPWRFWFGDFQGHSIDAGDWITLTSYGYFVAAEGTFSLGEADLTTSLNFENGDNVTHMLVDNFTGSNGDDLDTDDDGILDSTPWDEVIDCVALVSTVGSGNQVYCVTTVGPDGSFLPAQVSACAGSWHIGQFDPVDGDDTPNHPNSCDGSTTLSISELRVDQPSTDTDEYFELTGEVGDSLDGLTYIVIGDGAGGSGVIEAVVDLSGQSIPLAGGWTAGVQIPYMTTEADPDIDLIWGEAPKSQVLVSGGREESGFEMFVPVDDYAFDTAFWGHDLQDWDDISTIYQALNGNRVNQQFFWPWVSMDVNYAHNWVEVWSNPNEPVTVTLESGYWITGTTDSGGGFRSYEWSWEPEDPIIEVGDVITAEAIGLQTTVDPVGQVNIEPDFDLDIVAGTIEAAWFSPLTLTVSCEIWDEGGISVSVDGIDPDGGSYTCDFAAEEWNLEPSQTIAVRYYEPDGDTVINVYESPRMRINYAHDWVGGDYELGHTFWITVTESDGVTIKGTAQVDTWLGGGWGTDGFETWDEHWTPNRPDIMAGDWVYFQADDGYYNPMQVGEISGTLDIDADNVGGPIYANWFTETLDVECHAWGAPEGAPDKFSNAEPDGSMPYFCQWDPGTEWDIQPGQDVAVLYEEPDRDLVINVFYEPSPDLRIEKWPEGSGQVMPGGPVVFNIRYINDGESTAESFTITDTLPANTTYLTDTSGVPATVAAGQVVWMFGSLEPGEEATFQLVLTNSANVGDWLHNMVDVYVEYDSNPDNNHAEAEVEVVDDVPDLYVDKHPNPGDPVAGQTMLWEINYGNNGPVASGFVVLTDTLPADTTVVDWYAGSGSVDWSDYGSTDDQFVIAASSIPGYWGDTIFLRLLLSDTIPVGTQMTNTVEILTAEEDSSTLEDNFQLRDDVWTGEPSWGAALSKEFGWGQLVPGGEIVYRVNFNNTGNMATHVWLTDTLPVGTTFQEAWVCCTPSGDMPFPPDSIVDGVAYWDIGTMEPGESYNLHIRLIIDSETEPGTEITNCAEVGIVGDEYPPDNQDCVTETVSDYGPNLRVTKNNWWNWEGSINYEVRIENIGSEWLDNIWITDTYPISTTFNDDWWVNHGPWITATHDGPNRQLIFWVDELHPGEDANVGFNVDLYGEIIDVGGLAFTNTVEAPIPEDVYPENNYDEITAYTGPDIYIEKWVSDGELRPGEIVTFTVEFGNMAQWPWDGDDQYGSHITETLPQAMSFITATAPWDPGDVWVPEIIDGNTIVWGWEPMGHRTSWWFELVVQITDTVEGGDTITNVIEAFGDNPDDLEYNWDNNVFELPLTILGPSFEVAKTYETNMVAGTDVVYTVTVTNNGNEAGTTVVLSDTIPANLTYGGSDGTLIGGDVLWTLASVDPDGGIDSGWFTGTLACSADLSVDNEHYRVVSSDQGPTSEDGELVSFTIISPTITVSFTQSADTITEGSSVDFTAVTTTDGTALVYAWDFGDGSTGTGETVNHIYTTLGSYDVTLTVTDGCGYSEAITIENAITVEMLDYLIHLPLIVK